jgi:putative ABC transport system permease protein
MKLNNGTWHLIKSAFADFSRNKTRTLLTSLGITIGVMSVVMLIALGLGLKNYINQQFESLGANLIMIIAGNIEGGNIQEMRNSLSGVSFDEQDYLTVKKVRGIAYASPLFYKSAIMKSDKETKIGTLEGSNEEYFKISNTKMEIGELFTKADVQSRSKKGVIGYTLADDLFNLPEDALGKTVRVENLRIKIIGVMAKVGDPDTDSALIIPYKTTYGSLNPDKTFYGIFAGATSKDQIEQAKKDIKNALLEKYEKEEFSVVDAAQMLDMINQIFGMINAVLVAIGSISLLVGGIGIMNIMYATVTERTKEVGIRRAIGATEKDILMQFLTEAVTLSLLGGLLGLFMSIGIVLIIRLFFPAEVNITSVIVTLIISSGIGIVFGVFPARRAAKLPPIEAIRYE